MVRSIVVARVHDGLPLAATIEDDDLDAEYPEHKSQCKALLRQQVPNQTEQRVSVEAGDSFQYHILIDAANGVAFICLTDRSYPRKLAYSCLDEVRDAFINDYSPDQVAQVTRPYELIRFTNTLQRIKRSYQDVRARQNMERLQADLIDVSKIMTSNINEMLERGTKLEKMSLLSTNLSQDARRYVRDAQQLNWNAFMERYGVPGIVLLCFLVCLLVYFRYLR
jgi:vesicle transport protein SEC22